MQPNIHDALFKSTFQQIEHAASLLRQVLPRALAARIDFATFALSPGTFIEEVLKERFSDILFSAQLGGRKGFVYVLFEHQSTNDALMPLRLLRYMMRIWDRWLAEHKDAEKIPVIVPVVLHHSERGWTGAVAFEQILDVDAETLADVAAHVPAFRFVLEDISHESDEALRARAITALGRVALFCLRHAREPEELVARMRSWHELVVEVRRAPAGVAAVILIMRYILEVNGRVPPEQIVAQLAAALEEVKEEIVTAADQLREQGREQGREQASREIVLRQLRAKFGALPDAVVAQVMAADMERLWAWTERVITAPTLDDALAS
jgi:hypothetical protein